MNNISCLLFLFISIQMYCQNPQIDVKDKYEDEWLENSCAILKLRVLKYGKPFSSLPYQRKENSDIIKEAIFVDYKNINYAIVLFQGYENSYIFCNISLLNIENFLTKDYLSYEKRFKEYIMPYECDCSENK